MQKHKKLLAKPIGLLLPAVFLTVIMILGARFGSTWLSFREFFGGLFFDKSCAGATLILYNVRIPRILGAALAGAGLSVSGVLLQCITGNELASPNIIGVNSGAGLFIILLLWLSPSSVLLSPFAAFIGAFLTTLLIAAISSKLSGGKSAIILAGIAVTAMLNAGISFISILDSDVLASYNYFSVGSLSGITIKKLIIPAVIIVVGIAAVMILHRRIDTLCLGDSIALSIGTNVRVIRTVCMIIASACAAAAVSFAGLLGFVGLVVPNISRRLAGTSIARLIPVSALCGAILVVLADMLGRILFAPSELPVGIIMAIIGAPFFFSLLLRRKRHDEI